MQVLHGRLFLSLKNPSRSQEGLCVCLSEAMTTVSVMSCITCLCMQWFRSPGTNAMPAELCSCCCAALSGSHSAIPTPPAPPPSPFSGKSSQDTHRSEGSSNNNNGASPGKGIQPTKSMPVQGMPHRCILNMPSPPTGVLSHLQCVSEARKQCDCTME